MDEQKNNFFEKENPEKKREIVRAENLSQTFPGGVKAVDNVSFSVYPQANRINWLITLVKLPVFPGKTFLIKKNSSTWILRQNRNEDV